MPAAANLEAVAADVHARWLAAMRAGDFKAAWRETDRLELPRRAAARAGCAIAGPHHLLWDGTPFTGKRVLIRCNHGLGDTLQFVRFVPLVAALARSVTLLVQPALLELLQGGFGAVTVCNGWADAPPPTHDVEIEVMELAYALRATAETLPSPPYLPVEALRARKPPLPEDSRLRVGLAWATSDWNPARSLPLSALAPLAQEHVALHSLQQGPEAEACLAAPFPLHPLHRHTGEIADAAAAMLALDLVITVDGMVAHLAGALGRPVWLLLREDADWRWMDRRSDSPWYPSARLFRRAQGEDWAPAIQRAADALRSRA